MSDIGEGEEEAPLDPATERLRRKMVRLLGISVATMLLGVMAVLAAIVYKLNADAASALSPDVPVIVALDPGSTIVSTVIDGHDALLTLSPESPDRLVRIDLRTGAILARYRFAVR